MNHRHGDTTSRMAFKEDKNKWVRVHTSPTSLQLTHCVVMPLLSKIRGELCSVLDVSETVTTSCPSTQLWEENGEPHRLDGPALVGDGTEIWFKNGVVHCDRGPAIVTPDSEYYFTDGYLHRRHGPAWRRTLNREGWCIDGTYHRVDGPAITLRRVKKWVFWGMCMPEADVLCIAATFRRALRRRKMALALRWVYSDEGQEWCWRPGGPGASAAGRAWTHKCAS